MGNLPGIMVDEFFIEIHTVLYSRAKRRQNYKAIDRVHFEL